MAVVIPCQSSLVHYQMSIVLAARTFVLAFRFNTRNSSWYMAVSDEEENAIVAGIRIVVDWPLGFRTVDVRRPRGIFVALDTSGQQLDPGLNDLGNRVQLLFFEESDFA